MSDGKILKFPPGFLWGTATSPTQVEGHIENEWTNFTAQDGGHCRIACDHYHRYPEDIGLMSRLGVNAYRFGIEWSRLQSAPFAPLNQNELARYVDLLDQLKAKNITPMVVLHHFSNPPWINAVGGWTNAAAVPAFVDFVRQLVARAEGKSFFVEHVQRAGHLRLRGVSARRLSAAKQMAAWKISPRDRPHGPRPCAGQPHHPPRRCFRRAQTGSRHREELDVFSRPPKIFTMGPRDGVRLPLHVQQICAGRVSRRLAATRLDVHRLELLWPRAFPPFSAR